jgi:hypothetical protein
MLVAIGLWFVPMIVASSAGGDLLDYRNEILFKQTVTRYADAWHHHEPVWYYFTNVIPVLWLPLIALVPGSGHAGVACGPVRAIHSSPCCSRRSCWSCCSSRWLGKRGVYVRAIPPS